MNQYNYYGYLKGGTAYNGMWPTQEDAWSKDKAIWGQVNLGTMGTLENQSYQVIVPGETPGKYGGIVLLGTMGTILND